MREADEFACAGIDFPAFEPLEALDAEPLDSEAAENGTVDHRAPNRLACGMPTSRQRAHEASCEAVAGAGGVVNFLKWIGRDREDGAVVKEHRAVFAALDDDRFRTQAQNGPRRAKQI